MQSIMTCILIYLPTLLFSQDLIIDKNEDSIHCKIVKIQDNYFHTKQNNREIIYQASDIIKYEFFYFAKNEPEKYLDLIITNQNDSIYTKIIEITEDYLLTHKLIDGEYQETKYQSDSIDKFYLLYIENELLNKEKKLTQNLNIISDISQSPNRFSIKAGYSHLVYDNRIEFYGPLYRFYKELFHGYALDIQYTYFVDNHFGLGLSLNGFYNSNEITENFRMQNGLIEEGTLNINVYSFSITPHFSLKHIITNKNIIYINYGLGLYKNLGYTSITLETDNFRSLEILGNVATYLSIEYDYYLKDQLFLSFKGSMHLALNKKLKYTSPKGITETFKTQKPIYILQPNISVGISYLFI